ncbi:MAG: hypothetical protein WA655_07370 [Candidatus Korobacteraceae bacterium]
MSAQTVNNWTSNSLNANAVPVPANVRNAPLSADVITEYDRVLAYGGHIHREMRGKVFRDSQGRVRTETEQPNPWTGAEQLARITIQDPARHFVIHLDPRTRTATICRMGQTPIAKDVASATGISLPHSASTKTTLLKSEDLGTKFFDGVAATGTRTTRAFDGEVMENGRPVVMVTESWFAHDLQIVVLSETDDNQSGRDSMKLANIVRVEPNPQLFAIPPDYTLKESSLAKAIDK